MFADLRNASIEVWEHRELLEQLTRRDIKLRYKQAAMGFLWAVFMPCLIVLSGLIIRYAMAQISGATLRPSDIANIAVKGVGWAFFVGALGFATASLVGNANLVTKIYFPREVLPLSSVGAQTFDSSIGLLTLVIILPFLGVRLHPSLAWVPLLLVLLILFTTGVSLFLSCANLFFRDVKYIVQIVLMFGIFFTPIFFEPAMLGPKGAYLAMLNPLTGILEGLRLSVVEGHNLLEPLTVVVKGVPRVAWEPWELLYSAVISVGGVIGSEVMFRRLQHLFAEYV
ncbi:MAG TPA: ABC transporter permease [Gemmatimonadaceae bacterium]|jgi:ABC-type polysaccharide/polyol phosphate export permease|nr:ABC transporter permease [Gemmatimonadaceae bacterium]